MNDKLKLALKRMGYRHMGKGIWGKPVAHHLFTIRMIKQVPTFTNYFLGVKKQLLVWDTHKIEPHEEDYQQSIKLAEYSTRTDMYACTDSDFGFITQQEQIELIL